MTSSTTTHAAVHATSSCPAAPDGCGAVRPHMCRNADGTTRSTPHPARRALARAVDHDRLRVSIGYRLHLRTGSSATAWAAGREFDRDEAEALRWWLRRNGPILWDPTYVPPVV